MEAFEQGRAVTPPGPAVPCSAVPCSTEPPSPRRLRPPRRSLILATLLLVAMVLPGCAATTTTLFHHHRKSSGPTQQLAALLGAHEAYAQPGQDARPLELLQARRPITEERTVLPVLGTSTASNGTKWLRVMLPGRPDGRTGWIREHGTLASTTSFDITVDIATRQLTVYQYGRAVRTVSVVVGAPGTPTPLGRFFVEEVVQLPSTAVGAPYAFALSARSNVYQEFDGGPGQIALHGLANIGGVPGRALSHGCVRVDSATLAWMVTRVGPGVPVTIGNRPAFRWSSGR